MQMKACFFCLLSVLMCALPRPVSAQIDPYFTAINHPVPKGMLMVMPLLDYQTARVGPNFFTGMIMTEYGITSRWTVGMMVDGQNIIGMPATYGGLRFNTYYQLFPHDNLLHLTLYGEYEDLNAADIYKMEVSGFGGEDLTDPLSVARNTPAHTFEQRAIVYHDWGRLNATFNFVNEYAMDGSGDSFGYAWGLFKQPEYMGMDMRSGARMSMASAGARSPMKGMPGMNAPAATDSMASVQAPPMLSTKRLGYGLEMMGALGNNHEFGFYWNRQQQYLGPVFAYVASSHVSLRLEPTFGLSNVSDPFVLRAGLSYSFSGLGR